MAIPYPQFSLVPSENTPGAAMEAELSQDDLKKIAAYRAVELVQSGMVVGLGTGSTAKHAVNRIGELLRQGILNDIVCIPTSTKTEEQALSLNIPLSNLDSHPAVDITIDGADEVDPHLNLVKGRGGSLLREKLIEGASNKFVVIVDDSKLVNWIGGSGLAMPVEVVQFCWKFTARKLEEFFEYAGCVAELRMDDKEDHPYVTDNGNYIVDLYLKRELGDLKVASDVMMSMTGVVEHGMFLGMATTVIVAANGGITLKDKIY